MLLELIIVFSLKAFLQRKSFLFFRWIQGRMCTIALNCWYLDHMSCSQDSRAPEAIFLFKSTKIESKGSVSSSNVKFSFWGFFEEKLSPVCVTRESLIVKYLNQIPKYSLYLKLFMNSCELPLKRTILKNFAKFLELLNFEEIEDALNISLTFSKI